MGMEVGMLEDLKFFGYSKYPADPDEPRILQTLKRLRNAHNK